MENAILIANFYYHNLFENFSLKVEKNKFIVLSGPNNCGKTTLIRILNRELITEGEIEIFGKGINTYPIDLYSRLIGCVIPMEYIPKEENLEEELYFYNTDSKEIEWILKGLKIKKIIHKRLKDLTSKEFILYQLAVTLSKNPQILLIDTIGTYFTDKEIEKVLLFLKEYQEKKHMTIFYIARSLTESLLADYLYIMSERKIVLKGAPLDVLQKDNIINRIGLDIPFMIDLSVKLRDYELIKEIELEKDRMVNELWK